MTLNFREKRVITHKGHGLAFKQALFRCGFVTRIGLFFHVARLSCDSSLDAPRQRRPLCSRGAFFRPAVHSFWLPHRHPEGDLHETGVCDATSDQVDYPLKDSADATLTGSNADGDFEGIGDIRIVNR